MPQDTDPAPIDAEAERRLKRGNIFALEILFLGFIAVVVLAAFFEALTYKLVSSRTPFVIMAPLAIFIFVHARRLWRVRQDFNPRARIADAFAGRNQNFKKIVGFSAWMIGMVLMILVLGHYAGIFLFCVILMRYLEGERWMLTLMVAAATTMFIFGVFEYVFNIDLYRGLIIRYFLGFRDF